MVLGKMGELDCTNARDCVFYWPLSSQNVKKFDAGRANVSAIRNGVGDFSLIQNNVKSWRDEIGMIG